MMKQEFHIQAIELATNTAMLDRRQFLAAEMGVLATPSLTSTAFHSGKTSMATILIDRNVMVRWGAARDRRVSAGQDATRVSTHHSHAL